MCGIAGVFTFSYHSSSGQCFDLVRDMTNALYHRGPDGADVWHEANIALGHRRLSIVDLSEAGRQPMISSCERYVISYNGEVYNAPDLRMELEKLGARFRGHSDTEVIVEAVSRWGVERTVDQLIGMFAIGLWDRKHKELTLIRDRLGIKPLYWSLKNGLFLFGSELKALRAAQSFDSAICNKAVSKFLTYNCIGGTDTIYQNAEKLLPGHLLKIRQGQEPDVKPFWSLTDHVLSGKSNPYSHSDEDALEQLEFLLDDAVKRRMMSDVPIGAFLSGGIDSSTVVALMQKNSVNPVKTFSIGFENESYNEAKHAAQVARHLGTDHTELYVDSKQTMDVIPSLAKIYDEPFADSSQIPTYLISKLTREHVTVSLSGDGGDELFAGYNRYLQAKKLMRVFWSFPGFVRQVMANMILTLPAGRWNSILSQIGIAAKVALPGDKMHKLADVLGETKEGFYNRLVTHWPDAHQMVVGRDEKIQNNLWNSSIELGCDFIDRMQFVDTLTYLPDDILTKVDRASMAVSLEARVPLLDHRVVEYAWRLPDHMKIRDGQGKWILRQLLYKYVPRELIDRPKMGFAIPIDSWLRGPLRDWAEALLSSDSLNKYGLVHPEPVQKKWREHLSGSRNWQYLLWDILMLQAWCEEWA